MLKRYLPFLLLVTVVVACSKDKLQTKPSITIKGYNSTEIFPINNEDLLVKLDYKDKEGDLGGGWIIYFRNRLNIKPITDAGSNDKADIDSLPLPPFPKTSTGEIELKISGAFLNEDPDFNDTMVFKIIVKDLSNNVSDTVVTSTIVEREN